MGSVRRPASARLTATVARVVATRSGSAMGIGAPVRRADRNRDVGRELREHVIHVVAIDRDGPTLYKGPGSTARRRAEITQDENPERRVRIKTRALALHARLKLNAAHANRRGIGHG